MRLLRDLDGLLTRVEDIDGIFPTLGLGRSALDGHIETTSLDGVTTAHSLDISEVTPGFGDLTAVTAESASTGSLYEASYTRDGRGRVSTWTERLEGGEIVTRQFDYDEAGRLREVRDVTSGVPGVLREEYRYDGNGNRTRAFSSYPTGSGVDTTFPGSIICAGPSGDAAANAEDQLCAYGGAAYEYNDRGQLRSRSLGGATIEYTYDGLGRLHRAFEQNSFDVRYIYDALGRRIGKVKGGSLQKGWLYGDALNPIAQLDAQGNVEATFVYGSRAYVPDAMAMADGRTYRLITDHLGSVRLVVDVADGTVAQRIDYDSFGRVLSDTNPGFQPFGFAGGLYDPDIGLVRFGARDYDSVVGRWTSKDPIGLEDGSNLYAYSGNDPVNFIDPTGLAYRKPGQFGHGTVEVRGGATIARWIADTPDGKGNVGPDQQYAIGMNSVPAAAFDTDFVYANNKWWKIKNGTMILTPNGDGTFQISGTGAWDIYYPARFQPLGWELLDWLRDADTPMDYVKSFDDDFRRMEGSPCP